MTDVGNFINDKNDKTINELLMKSQVVEECGTAVNANEDNNLNNRSFISKAKCN